MSNSPRTRTRTRPGAGPDTTVIGRLNAFFAQHTLSPAHRRIARYLAENAPDSIFLSSLALSSAVGVSQPSTTRFAQALGYGGFAEMQQALRQIVVPAHTRAAPSTSNVFQQAAAESIATLDQLFAAFADPSAIVALGKSLAATSPLVVLGARTGAPAATHFATFAARIHPDVRLLIAGGTPTMDGLLQARQLGATWALCFLFPRYPTDLVAAARFASALGMRVATVTDQASDLVNEFSDVVLCAPTGSGLIATTYAAPMVMAGILLQVLGDADQRRTRSRLRQYERMAAEQHLFYALNSGEGD